MHLQHTPSLFSLCLAHVCLTFIRFEKKTGVERRMEAEYKILMLSMSRPPRVLSLFPSHCIAARLCQHPLPRAFQSL